MTDASSDASSGPSSAASSDDPSGDPVRHAEDARNGVFFIERGGRRVAELTYARDGEVAIVDHTWVDPQLRGGKAARRLVDAVVQWARAERVRIVPTCSYVKVVLARTAEYADVR